MKARHTAHLAAVVLACASTLGVLGGPTVAAGAAADEPASLEASALYAPAGTDLLLRFTALQPPTRFEKVQVKAWAPGADEAETWNFFDVAVTDGTAALRLNHVRRGDRLQIRAHFKDGPQQHLETETIVMRRPDLAVTQIGVPNDIVRTRAFQVSVAVAEVGGDTGADGRVTLYDGTSAVASTALSIEPGESRAGTPCTPR